MASTHFTREIFRFLLDLDGHNDRDWFQANKDRYEEHFRQPALRFISDFANHLVRISPHFRADPRPVGGSLFRIHRDVRFSQDKSPYKTHCGIHFRHAAGKNVHAPGYYLHLEPGASFVGIGIWQPDGPALKKIRDRIVAEPAAWRKAIGGKAFNATYTREGERLKRVPRGFPANHELADDLLWKDHTAMRKLTQKEILAQDFPATLARLYRDGSPFMKFLCEAVGQPF